MSDLFVIIEWNQASNQPSVACDKVYDTREEAELYAADLRKAMAKVGRQERYTVHELDDEATDD